MSSKKTTSKSSMNASSSVSSSTSTSSTTRCKTSTSGSNSTLKTSKPNSRSSTKSTDSQTSIASVGIGPGTRSQVDVSLRFRLMPEGAGTNVMNVYDHRVFDCIVFVITCEKHNTVALTNTNEHRKFSWFPFIPLQDAFTWNRMMRDGLTIILGQKETTIKEEEGETDTEMEPTLPKLPENTLSWRENFRVQAPKKTKFYLRITQLVKLTGSENAETKCCQNAPGNRIRWVKMSDIANRDTSIDIWGNEVVAICRNGFKTIKPHFLAEFSLKNCHPQADSEEAALLKQLNWPINKVEALYGDFLDHLYPAFQMTLCSFRVFVLKNSLLGRNDPKIGRLFRTMATGNEYISFSQLLTGIAAMDPKASNNSAARARFIFRYYDTENQGKLSSSQLSEMMTDLLPKQSPSQLTTKVDSLLHSINDELLTLSQFTTVLRQKDQIILPGSERLLHWNKSYFKEPSDKKANISTTSTSKKMNTNSRSASNSGSSRGSKSTNRSKSNSKSKKSQSEENTLCSFHKAKSYHYGRHAVSLDNSCRCVDSRIISEDWVRQWSSNEMSRDRYSVENVFRFNSVANIFYELVRDFQETQLQETNGESRGLLTTEEDWETAHPYLEMLCHQMKAILRYEPKLIRLAGPIYVIGDLQGSLQDLFSYENRLFRSAPAIPHTLLFLGNFSGPCTIQNKYGIECIMYLFALKILMPNKIYLLRGRYELRAYNEWHLKKELRQKYGSNYGDKIFDMVNGVFDCLPFAAIIEESILCTHSGIPQLAPGKDLITTVETDFSSEKFLALRDPAKMMPIGYEMITNIPTSYANTEEFLEEKPIFNPSFVKDKEGKHSYFNREAFDAFMAKNKFEFLIRSQNPCLDGYAMAFGNRCLTVFSSRRCNKQAVDNTSVVQLDHSQEKVRFIVFPHRSDKK